MFEDLKNRLTGTFYTIFTPFNEDETIDFESIEKYLTILYKQGARKFYAMAYNSRYSQLTHSEILELNEFCINTVKYLDSSNIVIVGDPIHCSTTESIDFTNHACECGADMMSLIVREKYFNDDQILQHYASVGEASGMALLVHEMPFLSGLNGKQMHWPESLIASLPKIPHIIALKEDAHDPEITVNALKLEPRIRVIIAGTKASFLPYKSYGIRAYLNGISIIDARIGELFWEAFENDDDDKIDFIINELEAPFFNQCAKKLGWHRTNKALLQAAGLMHRRDRMPLLHLNDEEFLVVQRIYHDIEEVWIRKLKELE